MYQGEAVKQLLRPDADVWMRSLMDLHPQTERVADIVRVRRRPSVSATSCGRCWFDSRWQNGLYVLHVQFEVGDWFVAESESQRALVQIERISSAMERSEVYYYVLGSRWLGALPEPDSSGQLRIPASELGAGHFVACRLAVCDFVWHPLHKPARVVDDMLYACET